MKRKNDAELPAPRFWIGSATRDHVLRGIEGGFCQLSHGRPEPLRKMSAGDWLIYYSGKESWETGEPCQRFTAVGRIRGDEIYQVEMEPGFKPFRRNVDFCRAEEIEIRPLIPRLTFIPNKQHWGFPFRRGYFEIPEPDFRLIAEGMLGRPFDATMPCGGRKLK